MFNMLQMATTNHASMMNVDADVHSHSEGVVVRSLVIGLTAFLTVVDLFATQAILPSLARHYDVTPAAMGFAVNASTMGMAVAGLAVGFVSQWIDRRLGILVSLALLSLPTVLLASAANLTVFTGLRICQGLCMASAFTLTLAYLGEHFNAADAGTAFAAYITGNVASNLVGRLVSAAVADHFGLATNFYFFAGLNLCGALLVNFVLVGSPFMVGAMALGFAYFVFLPSIITTPLAGRTVAAFGTRPTFWGAVGLAALGLPLVLLPSLGAVLIGLVLIGIGTFFAQAIATGFVGRAATSNRGAASGLYLASYFFGGLVGSVALGLLFDRLGWAACVAGIGAALAAAAALARRLEISMASTRRP
jgi:MFS transporter, YNFM family, putative membrane transport protein